MEELCRRIFFTRMCARRAHIKIPGCSVSGESDFLSRKCHSRLWPLHNLFSHPDYTVGSGITPDRPPERFADYTAGRESHPAPKNLPLCILYIVIPIFPKIKSFLEFYIFSNLHRKSDAFLCHIDGKHLHIDNVTDADSL